MMIKHMLLLGLLASATLAQAQQYSLQFDGDDDFASFPVCEALALPSYTIEGWIKCEASNLPQVVLMSYIDIPDKNAGVTLEVRPEGYLRFNYRYNPEALGGFEVLSKTKVNDNQWHHFAAVKEGSQRLWLYIDGFPESLTGCGDVPDALVATQFDLGRNRYDNASNYRSYSGYIDDLKIWEYDKTPRQIFENYQSESSGTEQSLFGNYKFDVISDTLFDCSTHKHHGQRYGVGGGNLYPQFSLQHPTLADKACEVQLVGTHDELLAGKDDTWVTVSQAEKKVQIFVQELQELDISLYDMSGKLLQRQQVRQYNTTLDLSGQPQGAYMISVNAGWNRKSFKVLIP